MINTIELNENNSQFETWIIIIISNYLNEKLKIARMDSYYMNIQTSYKNKKMHSHEIYCYLSLHEFIPLLKIHLLELGNAVDFFSSNRRPLRMKGPFEQLVRKMRSQQG